MLVAPPHAADFSQSCLSWSGPAWPSPAWPGTARPGQSGGAKLGRAARSRAELGRAGPGWAEPGRPGWPGRVGQAKHKEPLCAPPPSPLFIFLCKCNYRIRLFLGGVGGVRGGGPGWGFPITVLQSKYVSYEDLEASCTPKSRRTTTTATPLTRP